MKKKPTLSRGRPTDYTEELSGLICDLIATHSCGLAKLCKTYTYLPAPSTIYRWISQNLSFQEQYAQAKIKQIEVFIDEITDLSNENHSYIENGVNRCDASILRIKIDTRKWLASKLVPKVYGDKTQNTSEIVIKHEDHLKELE